MAHYIPQELSGKASGESACFCTVFPRCKPDQRVRMIQSVEKIGPCGPELIWHFANKHKS